MTTNAYLPSSTRRRDPRRRFIRVARVAMTLLLALGAASALAGVAARWYTARQHPAPGRLVDVGGYRLHLDCRGEGGPTVVLDAGLLDFSIVWAQVQQGVSGFTRTCVYDRAGLGWSEPGHLPRTSEVMVQELHKLLVNAGIEGPYVLVGHSFGGMNARLFAHRFPDAVAGMVLVDSAHEDQLDRIPTLRGATQQTRAQFLSLASLSSTGLLALIPGTIPNRGFLTEVLPQYRAVLATTGYFRTAVKEIEGLAASFAEVRAADINGLGDIPLTVMSRGRAEFASALSYAEEPGPEQTWRALQAELVALSPNGRQVTAEASGHYIQLEEPQLVVRAIQELVEGLRR